MQIIEKRDREMKEVREDFFVNKNKNGSKKGEDFLDSDEKVLWRSKPKRAAYVLQATILFFPFALLWAIIDFSILGEVFGTIQMGSMAIFIISFFALHLMPVWIFIGIFIKAFVEVRHIEYFITNKRIIEFHGRDKYIFASIKFGDIRGITQRQSFTDKFFGVGDIYIGSKKDEQTKIVLCDLYDSIFMAEQLKKLSLDEIDEHDLQFHTKTYYCEQCGSYFDITKSRCPSCGAPRKDN